MAQEDSMSLKLQSHANVETTSPLSSKYSISISINKSFSHMLLKVICCSIGYSLLEFTGQTDDSKLKGHGVE